MTQGGPLVILGSKVKVGFGLQTFYHFCTITPFHFDLQWWYFTHVLTVTHGGPLLSLESKGQRSRSNWLQFFYRLHNSISLWHTLLILHTCVENHMRATSFDFGSKGQIWTSNFLQFPHDNWFSIWHTKMILHTSCIPHYRNKTPNNVGVKKSRSNFTLNFALFPHDNSITFWHTMMILYAWIHHDPRRTSIDFCVNMSKIKV